jgi:trans-feruloyl-CoA hydratase/vanillin synthase
MSEWSFEDLHLRCEQGHATIRFARVAKKNAWDPRNHAAMHALLDQLQAVPGIKAVALTGSQDFFSSGMDLEEYFLAAYAEPAQLRANFAASHAWMRRWKDLPIVTVSLINGLCIGGGLHVAALSDIAITADEAVFGLSEVNFGIFPAGGTSWTVAQHLTRKQALYYALTAERFDGRRAVELGLASLSVPRERLAAEGQRLLTTLAQKDLDALRYTKRAYERSRTMSLAEAQEWETALLFDLSYASESRWIREGLTHFKRREYRPGLAPFATATGEEDEP